MPEYERRNKSNKDRYADDYRVVSPHQESSSFDAVDSRSQIDSHGYERGSSKSRDKERKKETDVERDREQDRHREKDRDRERDRDHDRRHRDHKDRERSERRRRHHDRDDDDYERRRGRDHDRHRDYDGERETRSNHRSRSRSRSRSKSKRISGFDMPPPVSAQTALMPGLPTSSQTALMPGLASPTALMPGLPVVVPQTVTQQATRHARRVYVGGLPPAANEQSIAAFFNQVMSAIGGTTGSVGDAVVNVYINHEKKFAFVEMRTVEEASNAMALDGIAFEGAAVKVRRPTDYNASQVAALGPTQPNPNLNLAAVGLTREGPADRIFVGGLPYYLTEAQIKELLETFGPLRVFELVKDLTTGNSKGYAFCVYQDLSVTDSACAALNGIKMGEKTLTVRRANQGAAQPSPEPLENMLLQAQQQQQMALQQQQQMALQKHLYLPTKVVCLMQAVSADELKDDEEYEDILEDMREEGRRHGKLIDIVIPRPGANGEPTPGVGKVFLVYADTDGSIKARVGLDGRKFGGNQVVAVYYPEDKFAQGEYNAEC